MSNCIYSSDGLLMCMESFSNCPGTDHSHSHDKLSNGSSCTGNSECNSNYCCPQTNVCKAKENFGCNKCGHDQPHTHKPREYFSGCPGTDHSHSHSNLKSNGSSCTGNSECNSNYCCPQTNVCKAKENFSNKNNVKPFLNIETFASTCGSGSYQSGLGSTCKDDADCISGFCNTNYKCANRV